MKISFKENDESVDFQVSEFDERYTPVLEMCFYTKQGDIYFKRYPKSAPYLDRIMKRYRENAQKMFDQLGYFAPIPWETALYEFARKLEGTGIDWWLTGSCAVCLRGIAFNPHDVDIMVNSAGIPALTKLFADDLIEPIVDTSGWVTKDFGVIFRHARIDIASDPVSALDDPELVDCGPYARNHLEEVQWRGLTIRVPPLQLAVNANRRRGRTERAKMIEQYLNRE